MCQTLYYNRYNKTSPYRVLSQVYKCFWKVKSLKKFSCDTPPVGIYCILYNLYILSEN